VDKYAPAAYQNVVRDAPEASPRRDITLGGVRRRHFDANTNVVRRKANP
jgi:hypothetical protein